MTDDPKSVQSLKRYYNDRLAIPDDEELFAELQEANDRSVVITLTAFTEDALEFVIAKRLRRMTKEEYLHAFRFDGPFGSFSRKIEVAYLMEAIDKRLRNQLTDLRELRNACAHSKLPISFKTPAFASVAKRLLHPRGRFRAGSDTPEDLRAAVQAECMFLFAVLTKGREAAEQQMAEAFRQAGMRPPP